MKGIAKFAAIDCDAERELCTAHDVKGFPTLKVFHRDAKLKPKVTPYEGARTTSGLMAFARSVTPNPVLRIGAGKSQVTLDKFFSKANETLPKVLVVKPKDTPTSPKLRYLALEHHNKLLFGEVIDPAAEAATVQVQLPGETAKTVTFDGDAGKINFSRLGEFLKPHAKASKHRAAPGKAEKGKGKAKKATKAPSEEL